MSEARIAALRAGLRFASREHRPVIQAMIDRRLRLLAEARDADKPDTGKPETPIRTAAAQPPSAIAKSLSQRGVDPERAAAGGGGSEPATLVAGDWRGNRRRLRDAGHEVKQLDGGVYIDGVRSDDPRLCP